MDLEDEKNDDLYGIYIPDLVYAIQAVTGKQLNELYTKKGFTPMVRVAINWSFNRVDSIRAALVNHSVQPLREKGEFSALYRHKYPNFYENFINLIASRINVMDKISGKQQKSFTTRYDKAVLLSEITSNLRSIELFLRSNMYL